jgi:outer membrane protein assembly factor BamB
VSRNQLALVDPDTGAELWRSEVPALAGEGTDIDIDMLTIGDVLVVPTRGLPGGVSGVDVSSGRVLWTYRADRGVELVGARSAPAPVVVLANGKDGLVLDARTGQPTADKTLADQLDVKPHRYFDDPQPSWTPPGGVGRTAAYVADDQDRGFVLRVAEPGASDGAKTLYSQCTNPTGALNGGAPR